MNVAHCIGDDTPRFFHNEPSINLYQSSVSARNPEFETTLLGIMLVVPRSTLSASGEGAHDSYALTK